MDINQATQAMQATVNTGSEVVSQSEFQKLKTSLQSGRALASFQRVLGDNTERFIASIISVVGNPAPQYARLRQCDANSIIHSAMVAAFSGLSIEPSVGQSALVPYGNMATFQPMVKGWIKLAQDTNSVQTLTVAPVYEGDIASHNPFIGKYEYNTEPHARTVITGYMGYIKLLNGYEAYEYRTIADLHAHAKRYSKTYDSPKGLWRTNFDAMAKKTVLKSIIKNNVPIDIYGSIAERRLATAMKFDQATPTTIDITTASADYPDAQTEEEYAEVIANETE